MMERIIAILIGTIFGICQFLLMRHSLKPLEKGEELRMGLTMLLRLPLPIVLLVGCALIDVNLLAFVGGAFCAGLILAAVVNHLLKQKKKG